MPYLSTQNWLDYYSDSFAVQPVSVNLQMANNNNFQSNVATTVFTNQLLIGESNAAVATWRSWIKPDFSSIPASRRFVSAVLNLTPITDVSSNARTMSAHRCLRAVVSAQATWNIYSTGNNWGTAGASNSTTDYDGATALGTMAVPASPTLNVAMPMTFTAAGVTELQKMYDGTYTNNGIVLFVDTQSNDGIAYASNEHGTQAYRPYITVTYVL